MKGYTNVSSSYRIELDKWLKNLDVKARLVIDIGGSQLPVKGRTKSWDVKKYLIADLESPHVDSPKPDMELDLNQVYFNTAQANLVFCLEVFDYVYNPFIAMRNINILLKPKGRAWVTFPSIYPLHQPVEDDALRYMPGGIKKLAEASGFEIKQMIKRRPETNLFETFYRTERMRAAKHEDHNFTGFIVELEKKK